MPRAGDGVNLAMRLVSQLVAEEEWREAPEGIFCIASFKTCYHICHDTLQHVTVTLENKNNNV